VLDGVYKICETEKNGEKTPAIMLSNNVNKITTPCSKRVWRLFDMDYTGNIEDYPENTSMRRAYKQYLLDGGRTGEGFGIIIY
jgi:nicotinic acid phosphoribosyltransferase